MKLLWNALPMLLGVALLAAMPAGAALVVCGPNPSDCLVVFDAKKGLLGQRFVLRKKCAP